MFDKNADNGGCRYRQAEYHGYDANALVVDNDLLNLLEVDCHFVCCDSVVGCNGYHRVFVTNCHEAIVDWLYRHPPSRPNQSQYDRLRGDD